MKAVGSITRFVTAGIAVGVLTLGCGASSGEQADFPSTLPPLRTVPTEPPDEIAAVQDADPAGDEPDTTVADETDPADTPVTESSVESVPTPSAAAPSSDLPRQTAEGITVSLEMDQLDFGNGPEDALIIQARRGSTVAGVTVDEALTADTNTIDYLGWAGSGGVFVVMVEVGPTVAEVQLVSSLGGRDAVAPSPERTAILGVGADDLAQISLLALDEGGNVVGSCVHDDLLLDCTD